MVHVEARDSIVVEAAGSHAIYVSQPNAVATIIEKAAGAVKTAATYALCWISVARCCAEPSMRGGARSGLHLNSVVSPRAADDLT